MGFGRTNGLQTEDVFDENTEQEQARDSSTQIKTRPTLV